MSDLEQVSDRSETDRAPGDQLRGEVSEGPRSYVVGFALASLLTVTSFYVSRTSLVWSPSIPVALSVLAVAQMGIHLVFFLHISSGPDSTNNVMALAFGILIVFLLIAGSLWIMSHLSSNMPPMEQVMQMQR